MEYLQPWKPEVLHLRSEQINMLVLLASVFRSGNHLDAYVDCFIARVRPRLIATFIDNNTRFFAIRQRHPEVKTLVIQNGWRGYDRDMFQTFDRMDTVRRSALSVDYILSFGSVVGAEYARYITGAVVPIGSVRNNLTPKTQLLQQGAIAFISQWTQNIFAIGDADCSHEEYFGKADRPILRCLAQYAREKAKRLVIIPRHLQQDDLRAQEEAYFCELLGQDCEFLEPQGRYVSYQAVDAADVVVAVDTTLGYESIARGNKTAMFPVRSNLLGIPGWTYGWPGDFPDEGPFWTNCPDPDAYVRILDHLFEIDDAQWRQDLEATNFSSLMIYNPGNSILKSILEKELGSAPVPPQR